MTDVHSKKQVRSILASIANPLVKYMEGVRLSKRIGDVKMVEQYAFKFLQTLIGLSDDLLKGETEQSKIILDFWNEERSYYDNLGWLFEHLSSKKVVSMLLPYVELKMKATKKKLAQIKHGLDIVNKIKIHDDAKHELLVKLHQLRMDTTLLLQEVHDQEVGETWKFAQGKELPDLITKVKSYCTWRLNLLEKPRSLSDVESLRNTKSLIEKVFPDRLGNLGDLFTALTLFCEEHDCRDGNIVFFSNENADQFFARGFAIATHLFQHGSEENLDYLYRTLIRYASVQKESADAKVIEDMLRAYLLWKFGQSVQSLHLASLEKILKSYNAVSIIPTELKESAVVELLVLGKIEVVDSLLSLMKMELSSVAMKRAVRKIRLLMSEQLGRTGPFERNIFSNYSYNSGEPKDTLVSKEVNEAMVLCQRIDSIQSYFEKGKPKVEDIPASNLPVDYSGGRVMLFKFRGKDFLRVLNAKRAEMHSEIVQEFASELKNLGFAEYPNQAGGGYIGFFKADSAKSVEAHWIIDDESGDYGECNKALAKSIVEQQFPGVKVITKAAR